MFKKMKLKFLTAVVFCGFLAGNAWATGDAGLRAMQSRGKVFCGTDLNIGTYAYKDDDGIWRGIDTDLCRAIAAAIVGRPDNFTLKHVDAGEAGKALKEGLVDVMLGFAPYSANVELNRQYALGALLYYDHQMFLTRDLEGATSMESFKGKRVCTVTGSEDLSNAQEYSNKYALDLKVHFYKTEGEARTAFLTKRCELLSGNEMQLKGIMEKFGKNSKLVLIPEAIATKPVYAFVDSENVTLQFAVRWIINALALAELKEINSKNVDLYTVDNNTSIKNLLGEDPKLWSRFFLKPEWVKTYVKEFGNYREVIDRNFKQPIKENMLTKDGGAITPLPFI